MPDFRRKPNRLPSANYFGPRSYVVTLCLRERRQLFTSPDVVHPLIALLGELAQTNSFDVYAYYFMPDHCHFLLCGLRANSCLPAMIRAFKGHAAALFRRHGQQNVWQTPSTTTSSVTTTTSASLPPDAQQPGPRSPGQGCS